MNGNDPIEKEKLERKRLGVKERVKRKRQERVKREEEIENGDDELEKAGLVARKNNLKLRGRERYHRGKGKAAQIMKEYDLRVKATVRVEEEEGIGGDESEEEREGYWQEEQDDE